MADINRYALIQSGNVINVILWDGVAYTPAAEDSPAFGWSPPEGVQAIELSDDSPVAPDWTYDGTNFLAPPPPPPPVLTPAEILANNMATRDALSMSATNQIAILTDATDPDIVDTVDPADVAKLKAWKQYRVALSKLNLTSANPVWPTAPSA